MPGPYREAAGKPPAVRKRPRRGQDPSLQTAPSTSARPPPQVRAATRQRAATHIGGGVHDAPETSCHRPSPGHPPGRACPAPTARRWASPMPSVNAHGGVKTPPYRLTHPRVPGPYNAYVNYIRRAGCPHPAASSRSHLSTGSHPRRGRRPRRPGNLLPPPIPGTTPGPGMPGPYRAAVGKPPAVRKRPRRGQDPSLRTDPPTSAGPYRAAVRERRQKNRGDPFSRDCLGSLYKHISA